jgi:hypothetical protein
LEQVGKKESVGAKRRNAKYSSVSAKKGADSNASAKKSFAAPKSEVSRSDKPKIPV